VDVSDAAPGGASESPPDALHTEVTWVGGSCVVAVSGEIDLATAPQLAALLVTELDRHPDVVVVDLRRVSFASSSGLGVLIDAQHTAEAGNAVLRLVIDGNGHMKRVLAVSALDTLFAIYDSGDQALAAGRPNTHIREGRE
jgi:anti-anti-sigma factor